MGYYFKLRLKSILRSGKDIGLPIWMLFVLFSLLFYILFVLCQRYPTYAPYGIIYIGWLTIYSNSNRQHISFLKTQFSHKRFLIVRLVESTVLFSPLLLITIFTYSWWTFLLLLLFILIATFSKGFHLSTRPTPTPFSKKPFEFIIFFRRSWLLFILLYVIAGIGVYVSNPNLCLLVFAFTCLINAQVYSEIEQENILWNYSMKPDVYLWHKIKRGLLQAALLVIPMLIVLSLFFPESLLWYIAIWGATCLFLALLIMVKYAVYPRPIGIMEFYFIAVGSVIPLIIFLLYFYYFKKAIINLKQYEAC